MRLNVRVSPFAPVNDVAEFTKRVEDAGFDGVGYLDSQMINRDVFVTMGQAGAVTRRLRLITAVTNPVTRHVSAIASAAATVDDVAPGRVELWIGRGFSSVNLAGLPEASSAKLRGSIVALRRLIAGEWDVFEGVHSRMRAGGKSIPIYLAAAGPKTTRLAGEVAGGLLLASTMEPERWRAAQALLEEGAAIAGRDASTIGTCISVLTCIRPTREEALRDAGPLLALRLDEPDWLVAQGIDAGGMRTPAALHALYPDPLHAEDQGEAIAAAETVPLEIRQQIANVLGIVGTPEDAIDKLRWLASQGVTDVFLRTIDTLAFPEAEVKAFANGVCSAVMDR
jgi:5,10-methylenetetrahydromethanopterin reductase